MLTDGKVDRQLFLQTEKSFISATVVTAATTDYREGRERRPKYWLRRSFLGDRPPRWRGGLMRPCQRMYIRRLTPSFRVPR